MAFRARYTASGHFPAAGTLHRAFSAGGSRTDHSTKVTSIHMATTNDLKNGLVLNLDGDLWTVVEFQHVNPGKGGAFVRTTLNIVLSGKADIPTFNVATKVNT